MGDRQAPIAVERRIAPLSGVELRADGDVLKFRGHGAVFGQVAEIAGLWREQIADGTFTKTITEADVRFLINHNPDLLGARTKSGTLRLAEDKIGLDVRADLDSRQSYIRDLSISMDRGDLDQMSFAFRTIVDEWDEEPEDGGLPMRTIKEVQLFDVSPVTFPAYEGTDAALAEADRVAVRSLLRARPDVCQIVDAKAAAEYLQTSSTNESETTSTTEGPQERAEPRKHSPVVAPRYRDLMLEQYRP